MPLSQSFVFCISYVPQLSFSNLDTNAGHIPAAHIEYWNGQSHLQCGIKIINIQVLSIAM